MYAHIQFYMYNTICQIKFTFSLFQVLMICSIIIKLLLCYCHYLCINMTISLKENLHTTALYKSSTNYTIRQSNKWLRTRILKIDRRHWIACRQTHTSRRAIAKRYEPPAISRGGKGDLVRTTKYNAARHRTPSDWVGWIQRNYL